MYQTRATRARPGSGAARRPLPSRSRSEVSWRRDQAGGHFAGGVGLLGVDPVERAADANLDLVTAHDLAHSVRDRLLTDVSWLVDATIHISPATTPPPSVDRNVG